MANEAVIGFPRLTDKYEADTGSSSTFNTDYPLDNIQILPLAKVARSDSTVDNVTIAFTFDVPRVLQLLAFVRHNLTLDATYDLYLYSDDSYSDEVYSVLNQNIWPTVDPSGSETWTTPYFWTGQYSPQDIENYTWTRPFFLPQKYIVQSGKFILHDADNADGFLEIGLLEMAEGWQLSVNPSYGAAYGFNFRSTAVQADGGGKYFQRKDKPRVFNGGIPYMDRSEVLTNGFELFRQLDIDTPFFWLPDPNDPASWLRQAFLARNVSPQLMQYAAYNLDQMPLSFEEVL